MRYCMTLYLNGHRKYDKSKLKRLNLLNKNGTFNFDLSNFRCPLSDSVNQAQTNLNVIQILNLVMTYCGDSL